MNDRGGPGDIPEVVRQLTERAAPLEAARRYVAERIAEPGLPTPILAEWERTRDLLDEVSARYNGVFHVLDGREVPARVSRQTVNRTHLENNVAPFERILSGWATIGQMAYEILNSPAIGDLISQGSVAPENMTLTAKEPAWSPREVDSDSLAAMPIVEVDRLRGVVRKGHFSFLDNLYRSSPGAASNPLGNFEIDQRAGFLGSLEDWLAPLLAEGLISPCHNLTGLFSATTRGRAFVARIIEVGH